MGKSGAFFGKHPTLTGFMLGTGLLGLVSVVTVGMTMLAPVLSPIATLLGLAGGFASITTAHSIAKNISNNNPDFNFNKAHAGIGLGILAVTAAGLGFFAYKMHKEFNKTAQREMPKTEKTIAFKPAAPKPAAKTFTYKA